MEAENHEFQDHRGNHLNIIFIPFYTASHIIPIVDTARLIAAHAGDDVVVHIITTHQNALLFENSVIQDNQNGSKIIIHNLKFPSKEVGLPEGIENINSATSAEMSSKVFMGVMLLKKPMEQMIRDSKPDCIISDMFFPWTVDLAEQLRIPRIHFNPTGYFPRCVLHRLRIYFDTPHRNSESETESFSIHGLPDEIQMKGSQLPAELKSKSGYAALKEKMEEAESRSYGTIMNSFLELEPSYIQYLKNVKLKPRFWSIAPMSLLLTKSLIIDRKQYDFFSWLDSQNPNSVLYVCFGSMVRFSVEQLNEIGLALESYGKPFIWVCRPTQNNSENEGKKWLPEGFEERIRRRNIGFVVKGWAPQVMILNHPSIGGFMNHCGWSSVMEAVTAGVPLLTWPLFAEQFFVEKLVVNVLKIGMEVGSEYWNEGFTIADSAMVKREKIEKGLRLFMNSSEEVEEMRNRAKELKKKAYRAVEDGGSSYLDLMALISDIKIALNNKNQII